VKPQPRSPTKSKSPSNQRLNSNQRAYHKNSIVEAKNNGTKDHTSSVITPVKPNSSFAVVIPGLPNDFKRNEYNASQNPVKEQVKMATAVQTQVQAPTRTQSHTQTKAQVSAQEKPPRKTSPPPPPPESLTLSQSSSAGLAVVIPDLPSTFRPQDYEVLPDSPDTPQHLSRKRKRSEAEGDEDELSRSVDQREKAEAAFRHLREYLQEIFEAEDQLQPDNFTPNQIFTAASDGPTLSITAQTKAENLLQKIISVGRFTQAPLDDLLRLQKLCDTAIKDTENVDLKLDETMGQAEFEQWVLQISTAELGMRAARTSLRLMSGGREEKQLYSEDVIHSALNAFKNITENCLIPVVEMRGSGPSSSLFKLLSAEKKAIMNLLSQCRRLFALMATLVSSIELSETVITTLEFTASKLIFVENAHSEKDSILGVSKFDSFRVVAMDVLAQIFLSNPAQRPGIFDEILTSLEKLPVTKQSARQFKLAEGGSIQLVSALIMRLIQTSAAKTQNIKEKSKNKALEAFNGEADEDESDQADKAAAAGRVVITSETMAEQQPVTAIQELKDAASPLLDTARQNATYVVGFIVNRAMKSTKTGDAPYRNLLDLFVEDFITCLNSTDWPAAELLLRLFLFKMVHLAEGDKTPAPAKNMALDLLAVMGAAISELNSHVRKASNSLESGDDDLGRYLSGLAEVSLDKKASAVDIVSWPAGPFRACLEFLEERSSHGDNPQLRSAIGFFMAEWASKIVTTFDLISDEDDDRAQLEKEYGRLAYRLRMMISDSRWLSTEYSFETVSPAHARLAYSLTLLHSQFCESFGRVLTILLGSMTSEQATVRSKSLRSVNQVLDTDPTIIDREPAVKHLILRCSNDISIQVRDSALGLIGKCIHLRPALEEEMIPHILQRVNDSGVGVRKRAIKLSKDIYLKNQSRSVRSLIADALLHRVNDLDEGVQELARQTIEEVWMSPFYQSSGSDNTSPTFKLAMADHVALMVQTVQRNSGVAMVLDKVLQSMLSNNAKYTSANFKVCKALVATMFETIIDNTASEDKDAPSARDALQILMIFAKSNPKLFNAEQVQLLQPYIAHVAGGDDLAVYRSVVVIFRHVLPDLSKAHHNFLATIRKDLIPAVSKMPKAILDDVVACLWIISSVLDDFQHLTRLVLSSLSGIQKMRGIKFDEAGVRKICKLLLITGICGKHCDLDPQYEVFQRQFPLMKEKSVSRLMTDTFAPFASPSQPLEVRKSAFDAIGMVCQSWPKSFLATNIDTSFKEVFNERESQMEKLKRIEESEETDENNKKKNVVIQELEKNAMLETIIMKSFRDFMLLEEKRSEAQNEDLPGAAADPKAKLGVMGGGQGDGVALSISQKFLSHVINIALSRQDDMGLLATELVASVARQGLVHPKETGSSLIALETSKNVKIAEIAFREHRALHEKHETILEKEYMRAVHMAYTYQKNVVKNTHGATLNPYTAKLYMMIEVMKISKPKGRKRFYDSLCARMQFDPLKMDESQLPEHLEFSQFIIENMAFFDYSTIDELLSAINAMEKVVSDMGTSLALSIETEIFQINLNQTSQVDENGRMQHVPARINLIRLRKLTAVSMMLSSLWSARTHLRRQYGLMINRREGKNKAATKDFNRAPIRAPGVTGDKFWEENSSTMDSLGSEEAMMAQCRAFVELLTIDHDFKIAAEGDEEAERARMSTPDGDDEETSNAGTPGPPGSKRGRKRKEAPSGTPGGRKNKRARSSSAQPRPRARVKSSGKRASVEKSDDEGEAW
jgi:cohesin loading factor subunit SCC2